MFMNDWLLLVYDYYVPTLRDDTLAMCCIIRLGWLFYDSSDCHTVVWGVLLAGLVDRPPLKVKKKINETRKITHKRNGVDWA